MTQPESKPKLACRCCGYATLAVYGEYEICPICFWEDDEWPESQADEERGGPNHVSLTQARRNFLTFGAAEEKDLPHVRKPREDDVRLRVFVLEDGRVVERRR